MLSVHTRFKRLEIVLESHRSLHYAGTGWFHWCTKILLLGIADFNWFGHITVIGPLQCCLFFCLLFSVIPVFSNLKWYFLSPLWPTNQNGSFKSLHDRVLFCGLLKLGQSLTTYLDGIKRVHRFQLQSENLKLFTLWTVVFQESSGQVLFFFIYLYYFLNIDCSVEVFLIQFYIVISIS